MPKNGRLVMSGYSHYIRRRGHNGEAVFRDADDYQRYLALVVDIKGQHHLDLQGWCLLPGEIHLLLNPRCDPDDIARFMQRLGVLFGSAYNSRHGHVGTLWERRFRCGLVQQGHWRLACLRYLENLPGRRGLTDDGRWPWSSRQARQRSAGILDPDPDYLALGRDPGERWNQYREFTAMGVSDSEAEFIETRVRRGQLVGNDAFIDEIERVSGKRVEPRGPGRPRKKRKKRKPC